MSSAAAHPKSDTMALHLTKIAFGVANVEALEGRLKACAAGRPVIVTTRYLPRLHEEIAGRGSLYWIIKHQLVARSPILEFGQTESGRATIYIDSELVLVAAKPMRAHQGWRYLAAGDAPSDIAVTSNGIADMPPMLIGKLAELALI